jgi:transposase-like protein
MVDHGTMKAYSEDLRRKVLEALEQHGTSKSEAARLFSISLSSLSSATRDSLLEESPSPPGREVEDPPKRTSSRGSSSRRTYARGPPLPSKRDATSCERDGRQEP